MKIKSIAIAIALSPGVSFGAAGIFDSLLWTTTFSPFDFTGSEFYNIDSEDDLFGSTNFHGSDLGTFNVNDSLFIWGEQKSFKNDGTDVTAHTLHYQVTSGPDVINSGNFNMGFGQDLGGGDQMWRSAFVGSTDSANVLAGLGVGNYQLEVWSSITTNGVNADTQIFNNNGGTNYNATFNVIPEPTTALLAAFGALALLRRRRA